MVLIEAFSASDDFSLNPDNKQRPQELHPMYKILLFNLTAAFHLLSQTSYNVTLFGQMNKYGGNPLASNYSEVWGWTDTVKNKEYAFIGSQLGTSVVEITTAPLQEVAFLTGPTSNYNYHEFRTYKNFLYIGAEGTDIARNAGIQIVDLSPLPDSASLKKIFVWIDTTNFSTNTVKKYYRAHTLSIEKNFLYVNGGDFGGTRIMDVSDPLNPLQAGSYGKGSAPYVHDAFIKNDTLFAAAIYAGRLDIVDLTTKDHYTQNTAAKIVSKTPTIPEGSTHQVWLSEDARTMFVSSEKVNGILHIYDISDRTNPIEIAKWVSDPAKSIHNAFVKGDFIYIAYYTDGFRVLDISNPSVPIEVAFYRTYTNPSPPLFAGVWGVYPYYSSGKVAVSDMNTGLYVFDVAEKKGGRITGIIRDAATQAVLSGVSISIGETGRKYSTDSTGKFLYGCAEGKHTVTFAKTGYVTEVETVYTRPSVLDTFNILLTPGTGTIVKHDRNGLPFGYSLSQNFPNPFNPTTAIQFSVMDRNRTALRVYTALGQEIATILDEDLPAGNYSINFDGTLLSSGVYFYRFTSGNYVSVKKMAIVK